MRQLNKRYWPGMVQIDYDYRQEDDIFSWCVEHIGRGNFRIIGSSTYYFASKEDATWFAMRWK